MAQIAHFFHNISTAVPVNFSSTLAVNKILVTIAERKKHINIKPLYTKESIPEYALKSISQQDFFKMNLDENKQKQMKQK